MKKVPPPPSTKKGSLSKGPPKPPTIRFPVYTSQQTAQPINEDQIKQQTQLLDEVKQVLNPNNQTGVQTQNVRNQQIKQNVLTKQSLTQKNQINGKISVQKQKQNLNQSNQDSNNFGQDIIQNSQNPQNNKVLNQQLIVPQRQTFNIKAPPMKNKISPPAPGGLKKGNPPFINKKIGTPKIPIPVMSQTEVQPDDLDGQKLQNKQIEQQPKMGQTIEAQTLVNNQSKINLIKQSQIDVKVSNISPKKNLPPKPLLKNQNAVIQLVKQEHKAVSQMIEPQNRFQIKKVQVSKSKSQIINVSSDYNELQQKLKRLQMIRSRIDQSSQEQYSVEEQQGSRSHSNIYEEDQQGGSFQRSQQENINIIGERNIDHEIKGQLIQIHNSYDSEIHKNDFKIGQTNYQEMEIKDQAEQQHIHPQNSHIIEINNTNNQSNQQYERNRQTQTVFQSNIATQQTQHRYLPDQISNSALNSQKQHKNQQIYIQTLNNTVKHPQTYHSQVNIPWDDKPAVQNYQIQQKQNQIVQQKSQGEIFKPKHQNDLNVENNIDKHPKQHQHTKHQSLEMIHDIKDLPKESSYQTNKQNRITTNIVRKTEINYERTVEQLLKQFKKKKSQYLQNLQRLKRNDEKYYRQQLRLQQGLNSLLQKVNHKNFLILKHANQFIPQNKQFNLKDDTRYRNDIISAQFSMQNSHPSKLIEAEEL